MKLSLALVGGLAVAATAAPFDLNDLQVGLAGGGGAPAKRDAEAAAQFDPHAFRLGLAAGHRRDAPVEARDAAPGVNPRMAPCPNHPDGRRSASWMPRPLAALLAKFGRHEWVHSNAVPHAYTGYHGYTHGHGYAHGHGHGHGHGNPEHASKEGAGKPAVFIEFIPHSTHKPHGNVVPGNVLADTRPPGKPWFGILPIFGEDVNAKQAEHLAKLKELKNKEAEHDDDDDDDGDDDDDHKKHKHHHGDKHKDHKHKHGHGKYKDKHHKGKHHKGHKHHDDDAFSSFSSFSTRLCAALESLPVPVRAFVIGAVVGAFLQVIFALVFLAVHLHRRGSREVRRQRRRERREVRRQAKAAYKAAKARKNGANPKAVEAGFDDEEALPSYAEGENDPLVTRG